MHPFPTVCMRMHVCMHACLRIVCGAGDFTLKTARLEQLDEDIVTMADFVAVFGVSKEPIQCAVVKETMRRRWVRYVPMEPGLFARGPFVTLMVTAAISFASAQAADAQRERSTSPPVCRLHFLLRL